MGLNLIWLLTMFMSTLHWLTNGQGWTDNKTSQSIYQEIFYWSLILTLQTLLPLSIKLKVGDSRRKDGVVRSIGRDLQSGVVLLAAVTVFDWLTSFCTFTDRQALLHKNSKIYATANKMNSCPENLFGQIVSTHTQTLTEIHADATMSAQQGCGHKEHL